MNASRSTDLFAIIFSFALPAQGIPFPAKWKQFSQAKTTERFALRRAQPRKLGARFADANLQPPYGDTLPAPTGGECRGGRERFSPGIVKFCGNADKSRNWDVETDGLCSGKRLSFTSSNARVLFCQKRLNSPHAGREREFHCGGACGVSREFNASSLAGGGRTGSSRKARRGVGR